ncbi:MAG: hypothetical protein ACO2PN_10620 [Pyrobaculum sp.]
MQPALRVLREAEGESGAPSASRGYLVDDARRLGKGLFKTSAVAVGLTSSPP